MKFKKFILPLIFVLMMPLTSPACGTRSSSTDVQTEPTETESEVAFLRVKPDSILFHEYSGLKDVYDYEALYSAEEWMDEEGRLLFPYDEYRYKMKGMSNILASLEMPEEVLHKACSRDILRVVSEGWLTSGATSPVFDYPSQYVNIASANIQAVNELLQRSDMAEVVLEDYYTRNYVPSSEMSKPVQDALNQVIFDEILLASNLAFSQMDDHMRARTLDEAMKKLACAESGEYCMEGKKSGFFAYIAEEQEKGGSLWYEYISQNCPEEIKKYLVSDYMLLWLW